MFALTSRFGQFGIALALLAACGTGVADDKKEDKPVELKVGDKAPAFEARTDADTTWESAARVGKKWIVVYFYPGDFTPGCTAQANAFRDAMTKLTEQGVEVIGVSGDSVQTHALFKKAQKLNFTYLTTRTARRQKFGVPFGKGPVARRRRQALQAKGRVPRRGHSSSARIQVSYKTRGSSQPRMRNNHGVHHQGG